MLVLHVGALFPAKLFLILTNSKDYNGSNFDFNINIHSHTNAYLQVITFQYIYEIEFKREEICIKRFQMQEGLYFLFPFLIMTTYQTLIDLSKDYSIEIIYRFLSHAFNWGKFHIYHEFIAWHLGLCLYHHLYDQTKW